MMLALGIAACAALVEIISDVADACLSDTLKLSTQLETRTVTRVRQSL